MKVVKSKTIGYCQGVENTINNACKVLSLAKEKNLPAYSIGALIHNMDVVSGFEKQGLQVLKNTNAKPGVALVRAHGISKTIESDFLTKGFELVDSTCQIIVANKKAILNALSKGRTVIVVGEKNHAEVRTLLGVGNRDEVFVSCVDDVENLVTVPSQTPVSVVVQTTFSETAFLKICSALKDKYKDIEFLNKLCPACVERKKNALDLAYSCDAVLVVGGKNSANTAELARHVSSAGKPVFCIENVNDFDQDMDSKLVGFSCIGVCGGTSTPAAIINEVCNHLEKL